MVRAIPNISVPAIGYPAANGGKMSFPVDPASLIYSHFEHVSGVAAPQGTQGVAISKLNLLDVLIGQLNQLKKTSNAESTVNPFEGVDSVIENFNDQVRQAKSASDNIPYAASQGAGNGAFAQSGALFDLII